MSFGRKRNMSKRWLRKNTPGTGKRGRPIDSTWTSTDQNGPYHFEVYHFFRTEKDSETNGE